MSRLPFPTRFEWEKPGVDGWLLVAFEKATKGKRSELGAGRPQPFDSCQWYGRILYTYVHDMFSEEFRAHVDEGFDGRVAEWLLGAHRVLPIVAAWGVSGRRVKRPKDEGFARAWVDVFRSLPKKQNPFASRHLITTMSRAIKELPKAERPDATALLDAYRAAPMGG